jgi:hypothetical protein
MTQALAPVQQDDKRQAALLKAVGLDKVPPEQRELAMAIADRYGLDLLLKHIVLIDGRPYITRDGLLHIAHRSGVFDGMEVSDPTIVELQVLGSATPVKFWSARCSVYRKDMGRPFTYAGRYPTQGGNQKFAPEMATKVAEVMALRRAFDVSAPVMEERWDLDTPAPEPEPTKSLDERIAERAERVIAPPPAPEPEPLADEEGHSYGLVLQPGRKPIPYIDGRTESGQTIAEAVIEGDAKEVARAQCDSVETGLGEPVQCRREAGHPGRHKTADRSW